MITLLLILFCLIVPFLLAEAFFSGGEITFISANRPKLLRKVKENVPGAALAKEMLSKPENLFSTTVVGTTLTMNCITTLATLFVRTKLGYDPEWINLFFLTPLVLVFGEFVPKTIARNHADKLILLIARPLKFASFVLYPLTKGLTLYAKVLKKIVGETKGKSFFLSREEIKAALPASRGSDVTPSERLLIERILEFGKITTKEMLRPLIDVVAIKENATLEEAVKLFTESGHSRLPVYRERIDCIVGIIQGFDCIKSDNLKKPVHTAMQPALFVPESKPLDELLSELKSRPMAIVVDEYGGCTGFITMEDVMEEVVGEIEDEYDEAPKLFRQISGNSFIVNARMEIFDLKEVLGISLPEDDDYQTLAGFLLKNMQRIPKKWDSIILDQVEYVIQSATDRSIEEVYVIVHPKTP
ncbi:MAG: HlyC/CorC family transporter [Deltaproteobacteria bacterium]|nr:HlyC/CorC family transporter [Deltaproteobacteria bacterium]